MSTPGNNYLSVTALCKLAGISRVTYYHYFDSQEFVKAYDRMTKDLIKGAVIPIVNAAIREGKQSSFQDRKMLLEMAGIYQSKSSVDLSTKRFEDLLEDLKIEG